MFFSLNKTVNFPISATSLAFFNPFFYCGPDLAFLSEDEIWLQASLLFLRHCNSCPGCSESHLYITVTKLYTSQIKKGSLFICLPGLLSFKFILPQLQFKKQVMKLSSCFLFPPPLFNEIANMGFIYLVYGDEVTISQETRLLVVVVCVHTLSMVHYRGQTSFISERKMNGILQYHPGSFLITNITSQLGITTRQVQHWQGVQPSA